MYKRSAWLRLGLLIALPYLLLACDKTEQGSAGAQRSDGLKVVHEERVGDYSVTLLNVTGEVKPGTNSFDLEFRKASTDKLVQVGNVQVTVVMPMAGMADMSAGASVTPVGEPGRYKLACDFSMAGQWRFTIIFANNQQAQFILHVGAS